MLSLREVQEHMNHLSMIFFKIHQFAFNLPFLALRNTIKGFEAVIQQVHYDNLHL